MGDEGLVGVDCEWKGTEEESATMDNFSFDVMERKWDVAEIQVS